MNKLEFIADLATLAQKHGDYAPVLENLILRVLTGDMPPLPPNAGEIDLAKSGRKIDAIKAYRDRTKCSLKDAKDAIDRVC